MRKTRRLAAGTEYARVHDRPDMAVIKAGSSSAGSVHNVSTCAVTFDDGPTPFGTDMVLDTLSEYGRAATFFVLASAVGRYRRQVMRIVDDGHEIGVHGWSHADIRQMTSREIRDALLRAIKAIEAVAKVRPRLVRPAYGSETPSLRYVANELGLRLCGWHVSAQDWGEADPRVVIARVAIGGVRDKVILLHDGGLEPLTTNLVLRWVIRTCRRYEIKMVRLSDFDGEWPVSEALASE